MQLVQAFTLTAPHLKISEINTDMAGRFPVGSTPAQSQGRHQNAIAEQNNLPIEIDKRIVRQLAEHITDILRQEQPGAWAFAAPAMINRAVISELDPAIARQLTENIQQDLVNIDPTEIIDHFEAARAA